MGCCGDREKGVASMEEKWDYVNLDDFKSDSCWTPVSYFFLWVFMVISFAVYGVDTFTAVNLLAFSRWSGRVEPAIPFKISRWIFAVCILVSFALLIYRWMLAIRAMRSGSITRSYLDPLAVRVQCFRVFTKEGRGWKRFLVFAELTKSKKGAEYVALYAYFSFQSWMNTIFADGPRQVLNAITLWSVMQADLIPGGKNAAKDNGTSDILQFFNNVKILAEENNLQAVVLFGMLFTLVIWVLSVLKLASAVVLYLIFLFHHIPSTDGTLKVYCRRKISTRLTRIVRKKVNKALANGFKLQDRTPTQPTVAGEDIKSTLPFLPNLESDKTPAVTTLSRSTTQTTLPPYTRSNSTATEKNPTLPSLDFDSKPPLTRATTQSSVMSESESLTGNAAAMGYSPLDRHNNTLPPVPPLPTSMPNIPPARTNTAQSRRTPGPPPFANDVGRNSPAPGVRNLTESGAQPYRPFSPAVDSYTRSHTPGAAVIDDYFDRSHTPGAQAASYDPYGPPAGYYGAPPEEEYDDDFSTRAPYNQRAPSRPQEQYSSHNGYQDRSYTPASTGAMPRPPPGRSMTPASTSATSHPPDRSMTPASYRNTPGPHTDGQTQGAQRTYTPFSPESPADSQSGYTAFTPNANSANANNAPIPSQTPQPRLQRIPGPSGYQPFARANTASPSTMNRAGPPAGYGFNRSNTNQY